MSMRFAEVKELSLSKLLDRESDATVTSTQAGVSLSRDCDSNNSIGRERASPPTPVDISKPGMESSVYISIIEKLQAKVFALQKALLSATDSVGRVEEELLPNEGQTTRQLRGEWARATEANNIMESIENISNIFTLNTFSEWSKIDIVSPGPMETTIVKPEDMKTRVVPFFKRHPQVDERLHVEPVIFVDISSAIRADPPTPYPLCDCARKKFHAEVDLRHLRADLAEAHKKLEAALRESETLRRERDEAIERGADEAQRRESDGAAAWAEARRLELQLAQWGEKERELRRLRVLMRFSELKKDSDMLETVAPRLDQMEEERERLLKDHMRCRAELAECRRQLREAQRQTKVEGHSQAEAEPEGHSQSDAESHSQSEAEDHSQSDAESHSQSEAEGHTQAKAESRRQSEAEGHTQAKDESRRQSEAESHSQAKAESRRQSEAEGHTQAKDESRRQSEAESHRQARAESLVSQPESPRASAKGERGTTQKTASKSRKTKHQKFKRKMAVSHRGLQELEEKQLFSADQLHRRSTYNYSKSAASLFTAPEDSVVRKKHRLKKRKT